eukprot:CAMPEP_0202866246 /NCGR_PEP_ID=MMETSP1391-20130828/7283_1 /ASSEMBLY_ACC=CAM_ASM_000867 /TAXON_ID=1034604 /ORGANISM="Chlamydomonas leiostraca, Strain SAG 11-49" /LENGTH=91 /DNA_ID=CAMNT_0049546179 /DNA_START=199 /DNA_END=474 /DNA_ORIENTATION=-
MPAAACCMFCSHHRPTSAQLQAPCLQRRQHVCMAHAVPPCKQRERMGSHGALTRASRPSAVAPAPDPCPFPCPCPACPLISGSCQLQLALS